MTDGNASHTLPPAGWFIDPADAEQNRWWDGARWTEHVTPTKPALSPPAPLAAPPARRRLPVWAWVVLAIVAIAAFVFLSPVVAVFALVVLVTAIVAVARNSPTWLRFPSRGRAFAGIAVSAVVFFAAGSLTGAIYPRTGDAQAGVAPAATASASASPSASATPSPTLDPVDADTGAAFAGLASTVTDASATDGLAALAVLATLEVKGRAPQTGYSRAQFGQTWLDVDRNGCDTRNDTLARDLTDVERSGPCKVLSGRLVDPYTAATIDFQRGPGTSQQIQIDHIVSLSDAWQKGGQQLTADQRATLANDPMNLLAVSADANTQKSDGDAATWLPKNKAFRCEYVARQVSVKATYGLWVTASERDAMTRVLNECATQQAVTSDYALKAVVPPPAPAPAPADPAPAEPAPYVAPPAEPAPAEPAPAPPAAYYANCTEVRAAGASPLFEGQPGYSRKLDRDGDGVACE